MSNWEEIRRLAADLQRIQLGQSAKKLSDQNCIEVVAKLIELGLVDLVFTLDGKEYLTKEYLNTQIRNECLANKGRINLVDLSQALNVDYQRIENHCTDIAKCDQAYLLSVGQLISRDYLDTVCVEINEKLQEEGRISLQTATASFDLPSKLIISCVHEALGTLIHGHKDRDDQNVLYTDAFVARQLGIVRAVLAACTRPTAVTRLIADNDIEPGMFFGLYDQLAKQGTIRGQMNGGRTVERAVFVPDIYKRLVKAYAIECYAQKQYLDLNQLRRLGITGDAVTAFLTEVVPDEKQRKLMVHLDTCVLSSNVWSTIYDAIVEDMRSQLYSEISTHLQDIISELNTPENAAAAAGKVLQQKKADKSIDDVWTLVGDDMIYSEQLISSCNRYIEPLLREQADREAPTVLSQVKKAAIAHASGTDSVDTKPAKGGSKGKKGKKGKNKDDDWEDSGSTTKSGKSGGGGAGQSSGGGATDQSLFEFMSENQLVDTIRQQSDSFEACPDQVLEAVAERLVVTLNAEYKERIQSVILKSTADDAKKAKHSHVSFQQEFTALYHNICMFDAGAGMFDESLTEQLRQLLLRTHCLTACHMALSFMCDGANVAEMSVKIRNETIQALPSLQARDAFANLYNVTAAKAETLDNWYDAMQQIAEPSVCALNLRQPDKKAKADLLAAFIADHEKMLDGCDDAAAGLLLVVLLLLARNCNSCVHATGKFVPNLIQALQQHITDETLMDLITSTSAYVVKALKNKSDTDVQVQLEDNYLQLKGIVLKKN